MGLLTSGGLRTRHTAEFTPGAPWMQHGNLGGRMSDF
jgi:hypothetical protein